MHSHGLLNVFMPITGNCNSEQKYLRKQGNIIVPTITGWGMAMLFKMSSVGVNMEASFC